MTDDLDDVMVARLVAGDQQLIRSMAFAIRCPEVIEAVRRLAAQGLSDPQIGERIGRCGRTILRYRIRGGIPSMIPRSRNST